VGGAILKNVEGYKPRTEEEKGHGIETAALVAALIAALDAAPAEALEIDPKLSWANGIEQKVRPSVQTDSVERGVVYLQYEDGSGEWLNPSAGEAGRVTIRIPTKTEKPVSKICVIHTHPTEINRQHIKIPDVLPENIPIPPSRADIASARNPRAHQIFAAADSLGVWYFSESDKNPNSKIEESKFREAYTDFIVKSTQTRFSMDAELPQLKRAYNQYLQGDVRFVSYEGLKGEPPCAGVRTK
jgi:hypothetical protein